MAGRLAAERVLRAGGVGADGGLRMDLLLVGVWMEDVEMNEGMNAAGPSNDEYETPEWLFKALDTEFGFTFDAAATRKNAKCGLFSSDINETTIPPGERVYCNPPYSKIDTFVNIALFGPHLWVMLLPSRTDTGWFRRLNESPRVTLRFLRKRVRFCLNGKEADSPRFGSIIAIVR
jgi:phage N-6-adenine-methyltransferase